MELYLFSMLAQSYYVIIHCTVSSPGHGREVVYGLRATDKRFLFWLVVTVQLPCSKCYDTQMVIQSTAYTTDVSLSK